MTINSNNSVLNGFFAEILATSILIYFIFVTSDTNANLVNDKALSSFIVILAVYACGSIGGNVSGGCMNPALGFAFNFVRLILTGNAKECNYMWIYIIGPSIGGILAANLYQLFFVEFFKAKQKEEMLKALKTKI